MPARPGGHQALLFVIDEVGAGQFPRQRRRADQRAAPSSGRAVSICNDSSSLITKPPWSRSNIRPSQNSFISLTPAGRRASSSPGTPRPTKAGVGWTMTAVGMAVRYADIRPLASKRSRKADRCGKSVKRQAMAPAMKTPPRAPIVTATLPATLPRKAQNSSSVSPAHLAIAGQRMIDDLAAVARQDGPAIGPGDRVVELDQGPARRARSRPRRGAAGSAA